MKIHPILCKSCNSLSICREFESQLPGKENYGEYICVNCTCTTCGEQWHEVYKYTCSTNSKNSPRYPQS